MQSHDDAGNDGPRPQVSVIVPARNEEASLGVTWVEELDEVLKRSDYVIIAANYNPSTHLLIKEREFRLMKPSAFFVNTWRGRIVEEAALLRALQEGWIAGAGVDVYWHEPPVSEPAPPPELFKMDNVILTPHIGSATYESRRLMSVRNAENIGKMIRGEPLEDILNPQALASK